jgi:uncharacterized protein YjeT (DUF2065 family)
VVADVAERRNVEEVLRRSESRLRELGGTDIQIGLVMKAAR